MNQRYFITATGTGAGKTLVTATLAHQLHQEGKPVQALKPLLTGWQDHIENPGTSDPGLLLTACGESVTKAALHTICPFRYSLPLSPDMATRQEHKPEITVSQLTGYCHQMLRPGLTTLIEGVGGVMVPLNPKETVLDWIVALACPTILITGSYLGALSHSLTALAAMQSRGVIPSLILVNAEAVQEVPLEETVTSLQQHHPNVPIAPFPRLAEKDGWRYAPGLTHYLAR